MQQEVVGAELGFVGRSLLSTCSGGLAAIVVVELDQTAHRLSQLLELLLLAPAFRTGTTSPVETENVIPCDASWHSMAIDPPSLWTNKS